MSQARAGFVFSAYWISQGTLAIGVGSISDRYGRDSTIALCMVSSAAGFLCFLFVPGQYALVAGVVFLGFGLSSQVAIMSRFLDGMSTKEKDSGFALIRTTYMCAAALASVVVGFLADSFGWETAIAFLVTLSGVALLVVIGNKATGLGY